MPLSKLIRRLSWMLPGLILLSGPLAWAQPLVEPTLDQPYVMRLHARARTVDLLIAMLAQPEVSQDPLLHEQVVSSLGRSRSPRAIEPIRRSLSDQDWHVQAAAAQALGEFPAELVPALLRAALAAEDNRVAAQAIRSALRLHFKAGAPAIASLLDRKDEGLTVLSITALTQLDTPLTGPALAQQLNAGSLAVRVAALHNARLGAPAGEAAKTIETLAEGKDAVLRGLALACLGKINSANAKGTLTAAAGEADWRVRAGAAEGLGDLGPSLSLVKLLSDPSPAVRLAASQAARKVKDPAAIEPLWKALQDPIEPNHLAARDALTALGTPAVASRAGQLLTEQGTLLLEKIKGRKPVAPPTAQEQFIRRQAQAASYILGQARSKEGYAYHLSLMTALPAADPLIEQVAVSLGQIGDPRAMPVFTKYIAAARKVALEYFTALVTGAPPTVQWNENAYASVVRGMVLLGQDFTELKAMLEYTMSSGRIAPASLAVMDGLTAPEYKADRQALVQLLSEVVKDAGYDTATRWKAARHLAKLKAKEAVPALTDLLEKQRPNYELMSVAAWAIQEITGTAPAKVGDPVDGAEPLDLILSADAAPINP